MFLYLIQHGEAKSEKEDPERGLTDRGIEDIKRVARFLGPLNLSVSQIFHSGKKRALQTAELYAEYLKPERGLSVDDGLAPLDDPNIWFEKLSSMNEDIVLVGHLPHLERLSSLLLCGDAGKKIINFRMGGAVCLRRIDNIWSIEWVVVPEVIRWEI